MPTFRYLAKRSPTETVEGTYDGGSRAEVLTHLAKLGFTPIRVMEDNGEATVSLVNPDHPFDPFRPHRRPKAF